MKFSFFRSIRAQLLVLVLVSVLPALGIVIYSGVTRLQNDIEAAQNDAMRVLQSLAYDHEHTVEGTRQFLMTLAKLPDVRNQNAAACNKLFRELLKENPIYTTILAADAKGTVFANALPFTPYSVKQRKYFQNSLRTKRFSAGEYMIGMASDQPAFPFAFPVMDAKGRIKTVIITGINLARYDQIFVKTKLTEGSVIAIFDNKNVNIYRSLEPDKYIGKIDSSAMIKHMSAQPEEGTFTAVGVDGIKRLYACKRFYLEGSTSPYLSMRVGIPQEQALSPARNTLFINIALLCAAFIMAMVLAWLLGKVIIVRKLDRLMDSSEQLGRGDLTVRTGLEHSDDELGQVTKAFDEMAGELERQESDRKLAEKALRENEERYRQLFEAESDAIFLIDNETGRIMEANNAASAMYGYSHEELVAKRNTDLSAEPEDTRRVTRETPVVQDKVVTVPLRFHHKKDGTVFPVEITGRFFVWQGRSVHIAAIRDITDREQAEEALRESEAKYRTLVETTDTGFVIIDGEGRVLDANREYVRLTGRNNLSEIIGRGVIEWTADYEKERNKKAVSKCFEEGLVRNLEIDYVDSQGNVTPIEINATVVEIKGVRQILTLCRDITERKKSEEALRESEADFRRIFDQSPIGAAITSLDYRFERVNEAMCHMLGYPAEELTSLRFPDITHPVHLAADLEQVQRLASGEIDRYITEKRYIRKDGSIIWGRLSVQAIRDATGHLLNYLPMIVDITERKRAEEAMRYSQQLLKRTFDSLRDAIFVIDDDTAKIVACNPAASEIFGYNVQEILGQTTESLHVDEASLTEFRRRLYPAVEGKGFLFLPEFTMKRKDGTVFPTEHIVMPVEDEEGKRLEWVSVVRDITERKHAEQERKALEERLQRAEKMEAVGTLAGGVAHDLNNVLGIVVGYAELLLSKIDASNPVRSYVMNIMNGGERAAAIVQDLLTLARRGVHAGKVINLNTIIIDFQKAPEFINLSSLHPKVHIKTSLDPGLMNITGSPVHLSKTLVNLVSNAAEAMSNGGELAITTGNQYLDRPVQGYDDVEEGDYVVLSVYDTGDGIPAADLKRIFEPFYTKKVMGRRSGTGLGLAVVWGTVKDHNGYINVQSEEGKGTVFTLYFPVTREKVSEDQISVPESEYMGNCESILVVDDIKSQRELATQMLVKLNYNVATVSSGEEAVEYVKQNKVDLIVLDMIMDPGIDGLDTYKMVLKINPKQKAIIVSGFSETERVNQAQVLGAGAYVKKPYVLEKLGLAIRRELDKPVLKSG